MVKVLWQVFFGLIIIAGLAMIMNVEVSYFAGMLLISIIFGSLFTLMNGKLIEKHDSAVIAFYEFLAGVVFISLYYLFQHKFSVEFFTTFNNSLILILASVCTAYAFTAQSKSWRN
jgi:hypothetical protein